MDIETIRKKVAPVLRKAGVKKAALFGSAARGEMKKGSDIDLLVEIKPEYSLLDFIRLKFAVEKAVKAKVDLVEYGTVKPALAARVAAEEVSIL